MTWNKFYSVLLHLLLVVAGCSINPTEAYQRVYGENRDWKEELNNKGYEIEYENYLNEVFRIIQTDKYFFGKMLEEYKKEGQTGVKMADHLHKLPRELRIRLNELKKIELGRLDEYSAKLKSYGFSAERISAHVKHASMHLDTINAKQFTPKDLRLLIKETTEHVRVLGDITKDHFKEYEMHKRLELEELKKRLTPKEQEEIDKRVQELVETRKKSKPMHMPLSKPHVLEIWSEQDNQQEDDFNLAAFFVKHDKDKDELWDKDELETLLDLEVSKFYAPEDEDYDVMEKAEEVKRMLDYIYEEVDSNKDRNVDMQEFYKYVKWMDTTPLEPWVSLLDKPSYTEKEYEEYAMQNRREVNQMIDNGKITLPKSGIVVKHNKDGSKPTTSPRTEEL